MINKYKIVVIFIFFFSFAFLFSGCEFNLSGSDNSGLNLRGFNDNYAVEESGISLNEYFGENITHYKEIFISGRGECLSGQCPLPEFENKSYIRDCYFCHLPILKTKTLDLISEHISSGASDTSFGCTKKYSGEEKNGFEIVEKTKDFLKVKGEIITYFSQFSFLCDKKKDPECDDYVYGKCDGADYEQKFTREVYLVFYKNNEMGTIN